MPCARPVPLPAALLLAVAAALPASASAGSFGRLPSDRVAFTIGRDLVLSPPQQAEPLNFFIYPYAEVDGVPVEDVEARFSFRRLGAETAAIEATPRR